MIPIALIDDHPLAINGIGAWLEGTGRFIVVGAAKTLAEAAALMEQLESLPKIIILDIALGTEDGLSFIPLLKEICEKRRSLIPDIMVCSMYEDPFSIQRAMDSGARAYVSKSAEPVEILKAIDTLLEGGVYINSKYEMWKEQRQNRFALTRRENEIVVFVKQNMSNKQIAKRLSINLRTVENHLSHIYIKIGVACREDLFNL
jgi:NarL family two-component system response regulator LiaR